MTPIDPKITAWLDEVENFSLRSERLAADSYGGITKIMPWLQAAFELGRASSPDADVVRETYHDLSELHIFLQGFDAPETGALDTTYDTLTQRIRDNALALAPLLEGKVSRGSWAMANLLRVAETFRIYGHGKDNVGNAIDAYLIACGAPEEPASGWMIIESDGRHLTIRDDVDDMEIVVDAHAIWAEQQRQAESAND